MGLTEFSTERYDGAGDLTGVSEALPSSPYNGSTSYAYDARSEVTGETSTRNSGYTEAQTYDGVTAGTTTGPGNLTALRGATHSYNADNQVAGNTYDGDGDPVTYQGTSLKYDPEGRLTADGSAVTNAYTGDGLRASKNAGGLTYSLYDGDQPVCELLSSGAVNAVHTFGPDVSNAVKR